MAENEVLLVAGMAGLAIIITVVDLILSMLRHRRSVRMRSAGNRQDRSPSDEAAVAARREWIRRRLSAIETASDGSS